MKFCLYRTALHACELLVSNRAFLFPTMYRHFMDDVADEDVDITDVCVSKSKLLTFLGNEFGNLVSSFCVDKKVGTVFHRTKADMKTLLTYSLHTNSACAPNPNPVDYHYLNMK